MKKLTAILLSLLLLTGCTEASSSPPETEPSMQTQSAADTTPHGRIDLAALDPKPSAYTKHDNQVVLYTDDEVGALVQAATDYALSPTFFSNVPKSVSRLSQFTQWYPEMMPVYDACVDFASLWKYLFPGAPLNERNLFWVGVNSGWLTDDSGDRSIDGFQNWQDSYDELLAQKPGDVFYMFYSPHFQASQPAETDEPNRFLELQNMQGCGLANFNKGVLSRLYSQKTGERDTRFLETFVDASSYLRDPGGLPTAEYPQTRYRPTATDSVTLTDGKSIRICDAVKFFEDYINALPASAAPGCDIAVTEVCASVIGENGECALDFLSTQRFEGILFDYTPGVTVHDGGDDGYEPVMSMGCMAVTDDVESAYGFGRTLNIEDRQDFTQIASPEAALKCCYDKMSRYADWEMLSAELVYCSKRGKKAEPPRQDCLWSVKPYYKFVLYNRSDALEYAVYIDAVTGEYARNYKATGYRRE